MKPRLSPKPTRSLDSPARERLLAAALTLFSEHGLHGTSTRDIAKASGLNVALISYHFGGKEQLYHELLLTVSNLIIQKSGIRDLCEKISDSPNLTPAEARRLLNDFLQKLLRTQLGTPEILNVVSLFIREQTKPSTAFSIIYNTVMETIHKTITRLFAIATGANPLAHETIVRAHMLIGQILSFTFARAAICRRLGQDKLSEKTIVTISRALDDNIRILCTGTSTT